MDPSPLHGVVYTDPNGTLTHLPLEEVHINVFLLDVSARVTLRQKYSNPSEARTGHAKYVFPVPARSAVCAFHMHFADGHVVKGIAKEKQQASQDYQTAVREGKASALVDWVTDGLFTISIGSIPARQTVTAKLVLVMDLMDDELKDQVRFLLPMFLGCRYGPDPEGIEGAARPSSDTRLRIAIDIQMSGIIHDVSSPSHSDLLKQSRYVTSAGQISRRRRTAKIRSPTFLTQNFVLTVRAEGLDEPRCFAERDYGESGFIALQLTMVPKFSLPPIPSQEFIFLVDRSGSMSGNSIKTCKNALLLLLPMLPNAQTSFNIYSFGDNCDSVWPQSRAYRDVTLREANDYINRMDANYGGTELEAALQKVFNERNRLVPTMLFVLTDGEIHQPDPVLRAVRLAVAQSTPDALLRVFSLGIGDSVTTEVVEGIAREGRGECYFATKSETIIGKCSKLLRAGRSSYLEDISIDWGIPEARRRESSRAPYSIDLGPLHVELEPPPLIQQMPHSITKIYPGTRFVVFALTTQKKIPQEVTLRGRLNGGQKFIEKTVRVSRVGFFESKDPEIPLIHTLAARRLITELTEERAPLPVAVTPAISPDDIRKAAIVRLGIEYQLASRYTSFVAVDDGRDPLAGRPGNRRRSPGPTSRRRNLTPTRSGDDWAMTEFSPFPSHNLVGSAMNFGLNLAASAYSTFLRFLDGAITTRAGQHPRRPPGAYSSSSSSSSLAPGPIDPQEDDEGYESTDTLSTLSSLESWGSHWSSERPLPRTEPEDESRSPTPDIPSQDPGPSGSTGGPSRQDSFLPQAQVPTAIFDLVKLQHFDGRFDLGEELGRIVGHEALKKPADVQVDDTVWATALAVAYLRKHLAMDGQGDVLDGLLDKVMESIDEGMRAEFEVWVSRASQLVL